MLKIPAHCIMFLLLSRIIILLHQHHLNNFNCIRNVQLFQIKLGTPLSATAYEILMMCIEFETSQHKLRKNLIPISHQNIPS